MGRPKREPCAERSTAADRHWNCGPEMGILTWRRVERDRKSTRLNSSHSQISYAVFCLKKKKTELDHIGEQLVPMSHLDLSALRVYCIYVRSRAEAAEQYSQLYVHVPATSIVYVHQLCY